METGDAEAEAVVAVAKRLEEAFRTRLALRVTVEMVAAGTLPRFEMKARRWVRTA
jgi:phenylacetate-coenzyme A ligase PaaK-like adenylate-forming protein